MSDYTQEFLDFLNSIQSKRPKTVIQHILDHGHVTSQELKDKYDYNHPPRAARDVREQGVPLDTFYVTGTDGRRVAAYRFGNQNDLGNTLAKALGRTALSKAIKDALIEKYGPRCFIYLETISSNLFQVDHRIPYEIGGNQDEENIEIYMLLSPSANRAKSWACEHCRNWLEKDYDFCVKCFWAHPENYEHVAGRFEKIISIVFSGDEIYDYNELIKLAGSSAAQTTIKKIIHEYLK